MKAECSRWHPRRQHKHRLDQSQSGAIDNRPASIDNPSMPHRAVLFDLDGTLADTLVDIADAANHALERLGRPRIEVARFRYLAGQGLEHLMSHALSPTDHELVPRGIE